jgi:uncharacterized protein (TIGR02145 family)
MKKLLFLSYIALAVLGCGGDQGELPNIFALNTPNSSSSEYISSSSSSSGSIIYDLPVKYDGKTYKTIRIVNQIWFQQDLEYGDSALYDWKTATTVCPRGWRLPTVADWDTLMYSVDPLSTFFGPHSDMEISSHFAGKYLKAASGWNGNGNGDDNYGFMALPSDDEKDYGNWWSADASDEEFAYNWSFYSKENVVTWYENHISNLFSVRCLKDR